MDVSYSIYPYGMWGFILFILVIRFYKYNINRQPLSEMLISIDNLPKYYEDIVKEELNVKKVGGSTLWRWLQ